MAPKDVEMVASWRCDGPWAVYNRNGQAPQPIDAFATVRAATGGEVIGFFCVGAEARVLELQKVDGILDLGCGMNPDWVGRGSGGCFGAAVLHGARNRFDSNQIRAVVQSWNERGIRVLTTLGFERWSTHVCMILPGGRVRRVSGHAEAVNIPKCWTVTRD
jgi:ribosomal-protein-alanine N-acetyltransferase